MESDWGEKTTIRAGINAIAGEMYATLASTFPVCCASDEFTFFPQAIRDEPDWSVWDDFSPDRVEEVCARLSGWEAGLEDLERRGGDRGEDFDSRVDAQVLFRCARALREQLREVRWHEKQPTFILTVVTTGILQAMEAGGEALRERIKKLPAFLGRSARAMESVPDLFVRMGIEMAEATGEWLRTLEVEEGIEASCLALQEFTDRLGAVSTVRDFRLAPDVLDRVLADHMGSGLSASDILDELSDERAYMRSILQEEAFRIGQGQSWRDAWEKIPLEEIPAGGKLALLGKEIQSLEKHCVEAGFVDGESVRRSSLEVASLPESLSAVRAADSYNARPGHPYPGGTFYVFSGGSLGASSRRVHPVYRMTVAHEAWPGHHMLDLSRWNQERPLRRPLEYALFYEGWACFAEELVRETGYFDRPYDRLILARRRYRHAVRGAVDILMHMGRLDLERAARILSGEGFPPERARMTVEKYALRPGYQMCYTLGSRKFRRLYDLFGKENRAGFVRRVMASGEIGFDHLEGILTGHSGPASSVPGPMGG
ncbi:MAG: DUF885 family protein [bacterium]|nr:MAG: DUF885 family protein [bacterium]